MRRHFAFVFAMALLILVGIYFSARWLMSGQDGLFFWPRRPGEIEAFAQALRKAHAPVAEVNLTAMYGGGSFQILHPSFATKTSPIGGWVGSCAPGPARTPWVREESLQCAQMLGEGAEDALPAGGSEASARRKQQEYLRIIRGGSMPADFLARPPYVDEFGNSYAALLSQEAPYSSPDWIRERLSFFKPSELKATLKKHRISDRPYEILSRLEASEIQAMVEAAPIVVSADYLLLKNESSLGFSPLSYWAYDARDMRSELRGGDRDLVAFFPGAFCLEQSGNACWTYASQAASAYVRRHSAAIAAIAWLAATFLVGAYARSLAAKNREQRAHRLSLQVLSHEFRTPVSAMLLLVEELSRSARRLPAPEQDAIAKISAEAFKLQRIVEMSKVYLASEPGRARFAPVEIPSINAWIEEFAADFDARLRVERLPVDQRVVADPFWLRMALSNLAQNAFAHGREPVCIRLSSARAMVNIEVEDQGVCEFGSLKEMAQAFVKSGLSQGMGLGLSIASAIAAESGGELRFKASPTSFSIALPRRRNA